MPTYRYTLLAPESGGVGGADVEDQLDELYGRDIWLDLGSPDGPNMIVTPAGDWKIVRGRQALRQSLLRRYLTDPGEWATKPDYGAGAKSFVKKKMTRANRDLLESRIREQTLKDDRVASVETVSISGGGGKLRLGVHVIPVAEPNRPLFVGVEIATS